MSSKRWQNRKVKKNLKNQEVGSKKWSNMKPYVSLYQLTLPHSESKSRKRGLFHCRVLIHHPTENDYLLQYRTCQSSNSANYILYSTTIVASKRTVVTSKSLANKMTYEKKKFGKRKLTTSLQWISLNNENFVHKKLLGVCRNSLFI